MVAIKDYTEMHIDLLQATMYPAEHVGLALSITMRHKPDDETLVATRSLCGKLWKAEHTSVFEHVVYCFLIENVSRSFLAQITRQRTASPTSGSQHYQNYSSYPMVIDKAHEDHMSGQLNNALRTYRSALKAGVPREEARQVLPNASAVNYLWTIDARNLMFFLRQRLCNRNVKEMRIFANRILSLVTPHFPELFMHAGPQCTDGECFQKELKMQCSEGIWVPI